MLQLLKEKDNSVRTNSNDIKPTLKQKVTTKRYIKDVKSLYFWEQLLQFRLRSRFWNYNSERMAPLMGIQLY